MTRLRNSPQLAGIFLILFLISASAQSEAGPISFNTALPVAKGEFLFRELGMVLRSRGATRQQDLRVQGTLSVLAYGVTRDLTLFGVVPYINKTLDLTTPQGRASLGASGLGDTTLIARYSLYARDRPGQTQRLAPLVGLQIPTGKSDQSRALGRLPQSLQPGSGAWDPIVGVIWTWQTLQWELDSSFTYQANTPAHDFRFGNVARFDLSYQYRVWPRELGAGVPGFVYAVLESNVLVTGRNTMGGMPVPGSGGTTWLLDPGIQYVTKRFIVEGVVQLPVAQQLNGQGLKNDYAFLFGFRVSF